MDKMFDKPWILRFTALFLAFLLFLYVTELNNDKINSSTTEKEEVIKNVPVEVFYDDENLVVTGLPETVNVTVKGPFQFVLQTQALKDFTVFADLRQLTIGKHKVTLQVENISDKLEVSLDPATVDVVVEEKVTKEFRVDPELNNSLVAENYVLTGMTVNPATVLVTGAKSVIESISYVKASVKEDAGLTESFEQDSNVRVLDRDLNRLDVIVSPETVNVKVSIEEYSKEISLVLNQIGTPPEGVTIDELKLAVPVVKVTGTRAKIDLLKQLTVDVDVSKITKSKAYEVEIALPDGVKYIKPEKVLVNAKVTVEEPSAKEQTPNEVPPEQDVAQ